MCIFLNLCQASALKEQSDHAKNSNTWTEEVVNERRYVTHVKSGDVYLSGDSNMEIRKKLAKLFVVSIPVCALRIVLRLGHLLSGHWAWGQGYTAALKSWRLERHECKKTQKEAPGRMELYKRVGVYSLFYFANAAVKCATLPIAALLMMGSSLVSIADPLTARRLFGKVEETWSIDLGDHFVNFFTNYIAPCMQPKQVWKECNFWQDEDTKAARSHFLIKKTLEEYQGYFSTEEYEQLTKKFNKNTTSYSEKYLSDSLNVLRHFIDSSHQIVEADGEVDKEILHLQAKCLRVLLASFLLAQ